MTARTYDVNRFWDYGYIHREVVAGALAEVARRPNVAPFATVTGRDLTDALATARRLHGPLVVVSEPGGTMTPTAAYRSVRFSGDEPGTVTT